MLTHRLMKLPSLFFALSLLLPASVFAGSESGIYLGAGVGPSIFNATDPNPNGGSFDFSETDTGAKIFAGYNFGVIPLLDLAIEGSYVDFGNPSNILSDGTSVQYELTGWDAFGLIGGNIGPIGIFGKAGMISWDSDVTIGSATNNYSGSDPAYGIGLKFQIMSIAARFEYEYFDIERFNDVSLASFSIAYTF